MKPFSYCHYCGANAIDAKVTFDGLNCLACDNVMWMNPTPVAVLIVPVGKSGGVFTVRRAIPPFVGGLALPGGFKTHTPLRQETWQQAAIRETEEEGAIRCFVDYDTLGTETVQHILTETGHHIENGKTVIEARDLIIGVFTGDIEVGAFEPNNEVSERAVIHPSDDEKLCFSIHQKALEMYWKANNFI